MTSIAEKDVNIVIDIQKRCLDMVVAQGEQLEVLIMSYYGQSMSFVHHALCGVISLLSKRTPPY